jgi:hypothetical protein
VVAAACCIALPAGATAAVLYDQTSGTAGMTMFVSAHSATALPTDAEGADDFTIPTGAAWSLKSVDVAGDFQPGTGNVVVYETSGGLPGSVALEQHGIAYAPGSLIQLPVSGPRLYPGHYWLSVYTTFDTGGSQSFWQTQTPVTGSQALWQSHGFSPACTTWKPLDQCGATTADFRFRLNGDNVVPACGNTVTRSRWSAACVPPRKKCRKHKRHKSVAAAKKKRCKHKKKHR